MPRNRLLILGGTHEARRLADELCARWAERLTVVTSLAGRTTAARQPTGEIRTGGFGGTEGLTAYLKTTGADAVIDATHPFAEEISRHAAEAASAAGIPRVILVRPPWRLPDGLEVRRVADMYAAAACLRGLHAASVLVTVGYRGLDPLNCLTTTRFVVRLIEAHEHALPLADAALVIDRPPYDLESETRLMRDHRIDALLTKESGGGATAAKLTAARDLGIPVVMIARPEPPPGERAGGVEDAIAWLTRTLELPAG